MLTILTPIIDIDKMLKLTLCQGQKVKGQGQICNFIKSLNSFTKYHEPMIVY